MLITRLYMARIRQYVRSITPIKIILLMLILFIIFIHKIFFNGITHWCDPEKPLWWFCPWPGGETICSWEQHFPTTPQNIQKWISLFTHCILFFLFPFPLINTISYNIIYRFRYSRSTISLYFSSPESYEEFFSSLPKLRSSFQFNNSTLTQCEEKSIDILIFVISKCSHASIRQSIRRTWGNTKLLRKYFPKLEMKLLFLVDIDGKSEKKISLEHSYHKDIVQVINLGEQYEYVTEREASLYEFVKTKCKQTKYLFKTDDDIFLNTFLLLLSKQKFDFIKKNKTKYFLFGFPIEHGLVVRHTNDHVGQRYIITKDEYSCPRYPTFLSGFGYLMSYETCSLFFNAYLTDEKPFPLSDVYFTGLLSQMINLERQTISDNVDYRYETSCSEEFFTSEKDSFACAASNDHFKQKESNGDRSLMNDYNLYWMRLTEKYEYLL